MITLPFARRPHAPGVLIVAALLLGCPPAEGTTDPEPRPAAPAAPVTAGGASPTGAGPSATGSPTAADRPEITLTWQQRAAIAIDGLKRDDALLYMRLKTTIPDDMEDERSAAHFAAPFLKDPRAAAVILTRVVSGREPVAVRLALVEVLPDTRGDWQEGASVLARLDPDAEVRKALVELMRHAGPPHAANGLLAGLADEDPAVRAAAARTAAFASSADLIEADLVAHLRDPDAETRAAVAHALGALALASAIGPLTEALGDRDVQVKLQALLAIEKIDPEAARALPQLAALSRSSNSRLAATARRLRKPATPSSRPAAPSSQPAAPSPQPAAPRPRPTPPPRRSDEPPPFLH